MNANELTFGIEIETTIPAGAIEVGGYHGTVQAAGLPEGWRATADGSIVAGRGRQGCEFVSPVLKGADGLRQVVQAVAAIKAMGGQVNSSCGFHVHVGFDRQATAALTRLVTLTANFEKAIYASTGTKSREQGRYCRPVQGYGQVERAINVSGRDRYHVLNLTNLMNGRAPAVEFRAFAGTLNVAKIVGHIRMCLGLAERALAAKRTTNWTAPTPKASSPIARGGEGQTAFTRLCYQLGWIKGRAKQVYGQVEGDGIPSIKASRRVLNKMAEKYDQQ